MAEKKTETQAAAAATAAKADLSAKQKKRQSELAQSGYRIPDQWYTDEEARKKKDEAISKSMTPTKPSAS